MLEQERTPHIEINFSGPFIGPAEKKLIGPAEKKDEAIKALMKLGFSSKQEDTSDSLTWEQAFPEYSEDELPGIALSGARYREGLTQKQLSELTGISQSHISEMEKGKRAIGVKIAKKFGKALNINYKVFL